MLIFSEKIGKVHTEKIWENSEKVSDSQILKVSVYTLLEYKLYVLLRIFVIDAIFFLFFRLSIA